MKDLYKKAKNNLDKLTPKDVDSKLDESSTVYTSFEHLSPKLTAAEVCSACCNHFKDLDIKMIYLAGSYMRKTASKDSDVDVYIITNPDLKSTLFHQKTLSKEQSFVYNDIKIDCKIYEKAKLYQMLCKCNPNLMEVLLYPPILYVGDSAVLVDELRQLSTSGKLFNINPFKSFKAFEGISYNLRDSYNETSGKKNKDKQLNLIITQLKLLAKFLDVGINDILLNEFPDNLHSIFTELKESNSNWQPDLNAQKELDFAFTSDLKNVMYKLINMPIKDDELPVR